ncbi:hypothetical protein FRC03_010726 [Tulasnella sp. 419]|nr:hypothetical protein FRC03_010726 [Tulasnella sp. 419]
MTTTSKEGMGILGEVSILPDIERFSTSKGSNDVRHLGMGDRYEDLSYGVRGDNSKTQRIVGILLDLSKLSYSLHLPSPPPSSLHPTQAFILEQTSQLSTFVHTNPNSSAVMVEKTANKKNLLMASSMLIGWQDMLLILYVALGSSGSIQAYDLDIRGLRRLLHCCSPHLIVVSTNTILFIWLLTVWVIASEDAGSSIPSGPHA